MSAGVSPRHAGARMRHWAGVRAALAGLGLPERAVTACKHFVAQARQPALAALSRTPRGPLAARAVAPPPWHDADGAAAARRAAPVGPGGAQVPGEATAALHRLRSKPDSSAGPRGLPPAVAAALECAARLHGAPCAGLAWRVMPGVHLRRRHPGAVRASRGGPRMLGRSLRQGQRRRRRGEGGGARAGRSRSWQATCARGAWRARSWRSTRCCARTPTASPASRTRSTWSRPPPAPRSWSQSVRARAPRTRIGLARSNRLARSRARARGAARAARPPRRA